MGPFSVFTVLVVVIYVFGAVDKTSSSFSAHGKIGNFIIIIIGFRLKLGRVFVGHVLQETVPGRQTGGDNRKRLGLRTYWFVYIGVRGTRKSR